MTASKAGKALASNHGRPSTRENSAYSTKEKLPAYNEKRVVKICGNFEYAR